MKISLHNFRNHFSHTLELPEKGLVRIDGRSGAGKSSILHAISWALFGKGRGITTWSEKTTAVELEGFGLQIKRTKNPNYLSVNGQNTVTAQAEIEAVLGMNQLEFEISSYVAQGQRNSLLNLSASEQLLLINALAFRDKDPEAEKDRIKQYIKDKSAEFQRLMHAHERISHLLKAKEELISSLESSKTAVDAEESVLRIQKTSIEIEKTELEQELNTLRKKAELLKTELKDDVHKKIAQAQAFLEASEQEEATLTTSLQSMEKRQFDYSKVEALRDEARSLNRTLEKLKLQESNSVDKSFLDEQLNKHVQKINDIFAFSSVDPYAPDTGEKLLTLKISAETALSFLESLKLSESSDARSEIRSKISDTAANMKKIYESLAELEKEQNEISAHNAKIDSLTMSLNSIKRRRADASSLIGMYPYTRPESVIRDELDAVVEEGVSKRKRADELASELTRIATLLAALAKNSEIEGKIIQARTEHDRLGQELINTSKQLNVVNRQVNGAEKIDALWAKAALDVIESTIAEINFRAAYWIDVLLEGKVTAELRTTKKVKSTKQTVDSINLQIMYRGQVLERVAEELSGGQYSRVVLAYQLAMSDMYNSPILMLDEAARGCDLETIEIMLDALRTVADRKLVIMIEHNIPSSHFDHEVQIAEV